MTEIREIGAYCTITNVANHADRRTQRGAPDFYTVCSERVTIARSSLTSVQKNYYSRARVGCNIYRIQKTQPCDYERMRDTEKQRETEQRE